mmetsp:Transcript_10504/g.12284  ORF Transcript_10504/g.12284 Transcript_10504/m.12284 type:complete len:361 (+) Transcript_10504:278-1360(+)|eukprot:CAMPEP_0197847472 /NCGR_PEP_ID=MMETSP1438-20131217/6330_1 /TAXON_ID=1461541 /ORGANISM="Pterosperma sp., Strain CCMP1384" /LENGTH=360 /DNA_ID=CAMNT_0043459407 /DNA_START=185 /DNA_END=1267 /DNA_ORIENTATION=-
MRASSLLFLVFQVTLIASTYGGRRSRLGLGGNDMARSVTVDDAYDRQLRAVKLYLELKGLFNDQTDLDKPGEKFDRPDCRVTSHPDGCASWEAICNFIHGRWIPGFEASSDEAFVIKGHSAVCNYRRSATDRHHARKGNVINGPEILSDFELWIFSRPSNAVPDLVKKELIGISKSKAIWPGDTASRDSFSPHCTPTTYRKKNIVKQIPCPTYPDDTEFDAPFSLDTTNAVAVRTMVANNMDIEGYNMENDDVGEEEGMLSRSHAFKMVFYMALALMGLMIPVSVLYLFLRASTPAFATGVAPGGGYKGPVGDALSKFASNRAGGMLPADQNPNIPSAEEWSNLADFKRRCLGESTLGAQ